MTEDLGGAKVFIKREDLNHTGSHKINNVLGQVLLAKKMGKTRVIAETGAGQHGVAAATAAALLGMECEVFMGKIDCDRQRLNVYRMELLGAKVHPVESGSQVLKDAVNETMREWAGRVDDTHYVLGSVMGPHPFPMIVRDFQSVISREARAQILEMDGKLPDAVLACVGGGSNAMGMFYHFIGDENVRLIGCEAAGKGIETGQHAATVAKGSIGCRVDAVNILDEAIVADNAVAQSGSSDATVFDEALANLYCLVERAEPYLAVKACVLYEVGAEAFYEPLSHTIYIVVYFLGFRDKSDNHHLGHRVKLGEVDVAD